MAFLSIGSTQAQNVVDGGSTLQQFGGQAGGGGSTSASIITGTGANGIISQLVVYRGTPATYPSFTNASTRSSDILIAFNIPANTGKGESWENQGAIGNFRRFLIGRITTPQNATLSGTASWFLLRRAGTDSLTDKGSGIGTIGLIGSGDDLELPTLSIVSGQSYQVAGFFINIPLVYPLP
jgi:hypothetical protein